MLFLFLPQQWFRVKKRECKQGNLSQPGDGMKWSVTERSMKEPLPSHYKESYIAASYVKFVESRGARAVPLLYNEPEEVLKKVCSLIPYYFSSTSLVISLFYVFDQHEGVQQASTKQYILCVCVCVLWICVQTEYLRRVW